MLKFFAWPVLVISLHILIMLFSALSISYEGFLIFSYLGGMIEGLLIASLIAYFPVIIIYVFLLKKKASIVASLMLGPVSMGVGLVSIFIPGSPTSDLIGHIAASNFWTGWWLH